MSAEAAILKALIQSVPAIAKEVREFAHVQGIDLGPEPPDLKADVAVDRASVDAELAARRRNG